MAVTLVADPDYRGVHGVNQLREVKREMTAALHSGDWMALRRLDRSCAILVEKVIQANREHSHEDLVGALKELKAVYATLIHNCRQQAAALAI